MTGQQIQLATLDPTTGQLSAGQAPSGVSENVNTIASSGTAQTLPATSTASVNLITLTANCTLTLPTPGEGLSLTVITTQDATGGRTLAWSTPSGAIKWPGGASPTYTTSANATDVTTFMCADGTNWLGFPAGYAMA